MDKTTHQKSVCNSRNMQNIVHVFYKICLKEVYRITDHAGNFETLQKLAKSIF